MTSETDKELLLRVADCVDRNVENEDCHDGRNFIDICDITLTISEARTISRVLREAAEGPSLMLDAYDAGLISDYGGGNVEWWQDYMRAELGRAHDHYVAQVDAFSSRPLPSPPSETGNG